MTTTEKIKRWIFFVLLASIAIWINNIPHNSRPREPFTNGTLAPVGSPVATHPLPQTNQQTAIEEEAAARKAAEDATAERARYLARYINGRNSHTPGLKAVAIVAVSEDGTYNDAISEAIAEKVKTEAVEPIQTFFTPEFVSDGLFSQTFTGARAVLNKLDLIQSLDTLFLARQTVQYSTDPSLNNVITATMKLEMKELPVATYGKNRSWSFVSSGAGFKQQEARLMAEERLIKQITNAANISVNQ